MGIHLQLINIEKKTLTMDHIIEQYADSLRALNTISTTFTGSRALAEWIVDHAQGGED